MESNEIDEIYLKEHLEKNAKYAKLIGQISIVSAVLSFIQLLVGLLYNKQSENTSIIGFVISTVISVSLAIFLLRYAKNMQQWIATQNVESHMNAYLNMKNYFIVLGVIFIVIIILIVLFFIIMFSMMLFNHF